MLQRAVGVGDVGIVEAGDIHDVANRSSTLATSIHAYSAPLRSMNIYATPGPQARRQRVSTTLVEHQRPVLDAAND